MPNEPDSEICLECQKCCKGKGLVYLTRDDQNRIAQHLKIERRDFIGQYCRRVNNWTVLRAKENLDCVFLEKEGCVIYSVRPDQCRKFPQSWPYPVTKEECPYA